MRIFCLEQNYFSNKQEQLNGVIKTPLIFSKSYSALLPEGAAFFYPEFANELYCRCELVLRISKSDKNIDENLADEFYDAVTIGINFIAFDNDGDAMEEELFWQKTKGWNNSSVIGKWLPKNNFNSIKNINFCLYKNREMVQLCNSNLMIYNCNKLIAFISDSYPLSTGDLIFTGTQVNIGELLPGDKLEAFIEDDSQLEFEIN